MLKGLNIYVILELSFKLTFCYCVEIQNVILKKSMILTPHLPCSCFELWKGKAVLIFENPVPY